MDASIEELRSSGQSYTISLPHQTVRKHATLVEDEEPLIDTTAQLVLHSKKTERMQKRAARRASRKTTASSVSSSLLDLPTELLEEILSWVPPRDLLLVRLVNRPLQVFIDQHEASLARSIIQRRYAILSQSFYLPQPIGAVSSSTRAALLSEAWQEKLLIQKLPYAHHIPPPDPQQICSCLSCVLAWNNLCLILDLAHFAPSLAAREPLPIIPRGQRPSWNHELLARHAAIVTRAALNSPLTYACILQTHLETTVSALTRRIRVAKNKVVTNPRPQYVISAKEARSGSDAFLARKGPPSYEFPFARDNYYSLEAYVPNRKWSNAENRWLYASLGQPHATEVVWVLERFGVIEKDGPGDQKGHDRLRNDDNRCSQTNLVAG